MPSLPLCANGRASLPKGTPSGIGSSLPKDLATTDASATPSSCAIETGASRSLAIGRRRAIPYAEPAFALGFVASFSISRTSEMERRIMGNPHWDSAPAALRAIGIAACGDKADEIAGYGGDDTSTVGDANGPGAAGNRSAGSREGVVPSVLSSADILAMMEFKPAMGSARPIAPCIENFGASIARGRTRVEAVDAGRSAGAAKRCNKLPVTAVWGPGPSAWPGPA